MEEKYKNKDYTDTKQQEFLKNMLCPACDLENGSNLEHECQFVITFTCYLLSSIEFATLNIARISFLTVGVFT
jgi:hypothetical protein